MYEESEPGFLETIFGVIFSSTTVFILIGLWLLTMIVLTSGKRAKIIERLGKPVKSARLPGLSFKLPYPLDRVVGIVNLQQQEIGEDVSVKTNDNAFMTLPVKVQYRAANDSIGAVQAHYELEEPQKQIVTYVLNSVKNAVGGMAMQELYQNRDKIETEVQRALSERFAQYGYEIVNVLIDEPRPSDEVRNSFNRVIASLREREAATNIAEARKIELVGVATAEKESKKLQGEGIASMREAIAAGIKGAMETLKGSGMTTEQALQLLMHTNRLDTLGSAAAHGNMVLVDMHDGQEMAKIIAGVRAATKSKPPAVVPAEAA